jgi:hypothetical protein
MAARFRKRPVEVEAVRWDGRNIDEVLAIVDFDRLPETEESAAYVDGPGIGHTAMGELEIPTLEGTMTAMPGDWVIRGVKGDVYPCKPDIFEQTYEAVV